MVRAAHSVGKPAYGVGPGNVPCYIDRSADLAQAARYLVASKSFDFSVICATEQAAVVDRPVAGGVCPPDGRRRRLFRHGSRNRSPEHMPCSSRMARSTPPRSASRPRCWRQMAGFPCPPQARILVARLQKVGQVEPLSREKLTTVLG